jgi:hypothetical protein
MKKFVILLTGIIFLFCFQGCSKEPIQVPILDADNLEVTVPDENSVEKTDEEALSPTEIVETIEEEPLINYEQFWTIDIPKVSFLFKKGNHTIEWKNGDMSLSLQICPTAYSDDYLKQGEEIIKDGISFYSSINDVFWDDGEAGPDGIFDHGLLYIRGIYFEKDGLGYSLKVSINNIEPIDIATPEMLQSLAENPDKQISGFEKTNDHWGSEFRNENIYLYINVIPPPFDSKNFELYADSDLILNKTDDGLEYYSNTNRKSDESNIIIAKTDIGIIEIHGGYFQQNDVKNDALDFINPDLIKYIYDHINQ